MTERSVCGVCKAQLFPASTTRSHCSYWSIRHLPFW